ncbi:MAG: nucleotidyltransferase family protein [Anaeromyxobacter sp.]|nr:nucleotidyltransferase family protein [Anaeromyxobacter sp.]MBL0278077.1 nucleotidyltransferase family protein [Anaeromyxobacter sp.]
MTRAAPAAQARLLCEALRAPDPRPEALRSRAAGIDWPSTFSAVKAVGLAPLVWNAIAAAGLEPSLPGEIQAAFREEARRNVAQTAQTLWEASRLTGALRAGGVECLLLKGAALAALDPAYGALRHLDDLDLLVRPADLERAVALLSAGGARQTALSHGPDGRPLRGEDAVILGHHHPASFRTPAGLLVELHVMASTGPGLRPAVGEALWARAVRVACAGQEVLVPSLVDLVGMAVHHALLHHEGDARFWPRLAADLNMLVRRGADPGEASRLYDAGEAGGPVATTARLLAEAARLDGSGRLLDHLAAALDPQIAHQLTAVQGFRQGRLARVRNLLRVAWRGGLEAVFPSRQFMEARYGRRAAGWRLSGLYVYRLWRALVFVAWGG